MRRLALLITLILLTTSTIWAAESSNEMILLKRENPAVWSTPYGNLYTFTPGDAAPKRLTTLGNIFAPALSPDGKSFAYAAIAENIITEAVNGNYTFDIDRDDPTDIWIMDFATHEFKQLTNVTAPNTSVYRSNPVWSPDSQQLAWFTWDGSAKGGSVIVYDLKAGKERLLASNLSMNKDDSGAFTLPNLVGWGTEIAHTVFRPTDDQGDLWLETIDVAGNIHQHAIAHTDYLPRVQWVQYQNSWWVAAQNMQDQWQLIQSETGTQTDAKNPPILQLSNGEGAKLKPVSSGWEILAANGDRISIPYESSADISPDGQSVVYLRERKAFLWREGQTIVPLLPAKAADWEIITVLWSPMIWVAS